MSGRTRSHENLDGTNLVLVDDDVSFARQMLSERAFERITLKQGTWADLSFLVDHADAYRELIIREPVGDWPSIARLHSLTELTIDPPIPAELSFRRLDALRGLRVRWCKDTRADLIDLHHLIHLKVAWFGGPSCAAFRGLEGLEQLYIIDSRKLETLDGLDGCEALSGLSIVSAPRLTDVSAVRRASRLRTVNLEGANRLSDYAALGPHDGLRQLVIARSGDLASLDFLRRLPSLEYFAFGNGTKLLDGRIDVLGSLPALRSCRFPANRHYSGTEQEVFRHLEEAGRLAPEPRTRPYATAAELVGALR